MKTLVITGAARKNGHTAKMVELFLNTLGGEYTIIDAYRAENIAPCKDCRYCWHKKGCSIHDGMDEVYCPSKAGVIMLTKCIALEYAPKVRVNCVQPGLVRTPMIEQRFQEAEDPAALEESYASLYPLHKMGKVADMANAVKFLSCSEDSGFITGEIMNVCGGSLI